MYEVSTIKIDTDEDGFWLLIETPNAMGPNIDNNRLRVKIQDPEGFYDHVKSEIGPWLYERDMAQTDLSGYTAARENIKNARGGYALTDPKHPDWHSVHADHYDEQC